MIDHDAGPEFTLAEKFPFLADIRFIDVEASGLHQGSFPLQFGWSGLNLMPKSVLVRPTVAWTQDLYDPLSFDIHGISYDDAMSSGHDVVEVAHLLNRELSGKVVATDSPGYDGGWIMELSVASNVPLAFKWSDFGQIFQSETLSPVFDRWCVSKYHLLQEAVHLHYPHNHDAAADVTRLAALARMVMDREWSEWLLERPDPAPRQPNDGSSLPGL